jgi:hypothetical protein
MCGAERESDGHDITGRSFPLALVPSSTPFYHNTMRFQTVLRARSLLQRAPVGCTFGRRAIQTASSTRVPDFAFAFE